LFTALALFLSLALGAALVQAQDPQRVGLVVAHGEQVVQRCIEFTEPDLNGYELLERSGLEIKVDVSGGMDVAICRIDGQGCDYPAEDCFCQCQGNACQFWIYWHLRDGQWQSSNVSASSYQVRHGDVEGWVWGEGGPDGSGASPPPVRFEEICAPGAAVVAANQPGHPGPAPAPLLEGRLAITLGVVAVLLLLGGLTWRRWRR
jgi:hypothetical protein